MSVVVNAANFVDYINEFHPNDGIPQENINEVQDALNSFAHLLAQNLSNKEEADRYQYTYLSNIAARIIKNRDEVAAAIGAMPDNIQRKNILIQAQIEHKDVGRFLATQDPDDPIVQVAMMAHNVGTMTRSARALHGFIDHMYTTTIH